IELPRDLLTALDIPEADLSRRAKEWIALELFQEGQISAGKAGEILGLSKSPFLDLLAAHPLPSLHADLPELERGAAAAHAARPRARGWVGVGSPPASTRRPAVWRASCRSGVRNTRSARLYSPDD